MNFVHNAVTSFRLTIIDNGPELSEHLMIIEENCKSVYCEMSLLSYWTTSFKIEYLVKKN